MPPAAQVLLGVPDLWDMRNGLLLCRSIERAFDNSELCFYRGDDGSLLVHVLNSQLLNSKAGPG